MNQYVLSVFVTSPIKSTEVFDFTLKNEYSMTTAFLKLEWIFFFKFDQDLESGILDDETIYKYIFVKKLSTHMHNKRYLISTLYLLKAYKKYY